MDASWQNSPLYRAIKAYVDDLYDGNPRAAARSLDVKYETFRSWYTGRSAPRTNSIGKALELLKASGKLIDVEPNQIGIPQPTTPDTEKSNFSLKAFEDYELVPRAIAVAGAGESLRTEEGLSSLYAFRREFLRREGICAKDALMMYVSGDSMEPTIMDKDTILIDKRDNVPKDGYIYVLSLGDTLMVKRMQRIADGWMLQSDNPKYAPVTVQGQEQEKMVVHGRVRWFSRVI